MKIKTNELKGTALDYAVAMCEGHIGSRVGFDEVWLWDNAYGEHWCPSSDWSQAGPIIERECYAIVPPDSSVPVWTVGKWDDGLDDSVRFGSSLLQAAMRCYVASKLGEEVDIPSELL